MSIETAYWRLREPTTEALNRTVCIPTVHPVGDQRVLRCTQAVLDAGYSVHLIWIGGEPGTFRHHERVRETRLAPAGSFRQRLRAIPDLIRRAWRLDADMWHIHDFYLLPFAKAWSKMSRRPVIYDVHEYYPEYYSARLPGTVATRAALKAVIWSVEHRLAAGMGANAVSETLARRFEKAGIIAAATPNFPATAEFRAAARPLTARLLRRVIHTGTLNREYGAHVIIEIAHELAALHDGVEIVVVRRFLNESARADFEAAFTQNEMPPNLTMIDPVPAHKVAGLLATFGIGISVLQDGGQAPVAVPTKLYEYAIAGLAIVTSELPASRRFVEESAVGQAVRPDQPKAFARAVIDLIEHADVICPHVDRAAQNAADALSWDEVCVPRIAWLTRQLDRMPAPRPRDAEELPINVRARR